MNVGKKNHWVHYKTIVLSLLLYIVALTYIYQAFNIENKYSIFSPDEIFYYHEAKAISAHNIYQTPLSLDGNTSFIGNFGSHGISYAVLDGLMSKLLLQPDSPPIMWINLLLALATLFLVLLYKEISYTTRLSISLIIASHYVFFTFTLSAMQETVHFLLAVIALRILYKIYRQANTISNKLIFHYIAIVLIAITFRYSWFLWGIGLLPLFWNKKTIIKWIFIMAGLLLFSLFIGRYIYAPYPYEEITVYRILRTENISLLEACKLIIQQFFDNITTYLTPTGVRTSTVCMRYLLLILLITNSVFAYIKRDKFIIACILIGWSYFVICMALYFLTWQADERILALLTPLTAFSFINVLNSTIHYPVIIFQLLLLPTIINDREESYINPVSNEIIEMERQKKEAAFIKMKNLITDESDVVISLPIKLTWHYRPNYIVNMPFVTNKGYAIHYRLHVNGSDLRKTHKANYLIEFTSVLSQEKQLLYNDDLFYFYKLTP